MSTTVKLDRLNIEVPWLIEQYRTHLHWGQFDQAMDCMEQASALAVAACRRELRQLGMAATEDELTKLLCERIRPHRNRGSLKNATESSPHNSRVSSPWKMPWGSVPKRRRKLWRADGWSWPPPLRASPSNMRRSR